MKSLFCELMNRVNLVRGISTVEVMLMLLGMSIVMLSSYGAKASAFQNYHQIIHHERAQLYAMETLEQIEAIRLTRMKQDYMRSWDLFLGNKDSGNYELISGRSLSDLHLLPQSKELLDFEENSSSLRVYDEKEDGFYSRLERRISIEQVKDNQYRVSVSIYWGVPGGYRTKSFEQVILQALYRDQVGPGFAV